MDNWTGMMSGLARRPRPGSMGTLGRCFHPDASLPPSNLHHLLRVGRCHPSLKSPRRSWLPYSPLLSSPRRSRRSLAHLASEEVIAQPPGVLAAERDMEEVLAAGEAVMRDM